jgi:hypothetical protein
MIQASEMRDPQQKYLAVTMAEDNLLRLNGFFFFFLFHAGFHVQRVDPGLKMWDTFALATVLTLKSDPEHPSQ